MSAFLRISQQPPTSFSPPTTPPTTTTPPGASQQTDGDRASILENIFNMVNTDYTTGEGLIKETKITKEFKEQIRAKKDWLIENAAYGLNSNTGEKNIASFRNPSEVIITHDHVEPKVDNGTADMFYNAGPGNGNMNLTQYREGGNRSEFYRGIFRHLMTKSDPFETGGRANVLWMDWHVEHIQETTGDDVPERWYTGK